LRLVADIYERHQVARRHQPNLLIALADVGIEHGVVSLQNMCKRREFEGTW
jgi:hypothetical protein